MSVISSSVMLASWFSKSKIGGSSGNGRTGTFSTEAVYPNSPFGAIDGDDERQTARANANLKTHLRKKGQRKTSQVLNCLVEIFAKCQALKTVWLKSLPNVKL